MNELRQFFIKPQIKAIVFAIFTLVIGVLSNIEVNKKPYYWWIILAATIIVYFVVLFFYTHLEENINAKLMQKEKELAEQKKQK